MITPHDAGYERHRKVYNRRFDDVRPALLVLPETERDVQRAIAWARQENVRLHPRGGGHGYLGNATGPGMVIDLRRMAAVTPAGPTMVDVGGGARLIEVAAALASRGAALPLGSCPSVGVAGFTLGGGIGLSSRLLGLGCDRLEEVSMVTADARVVRASAAENPALLWACRGGGGGQLGIVTRLRFAPAPARRVAWFTLDVPWERAADALALWQTWAPAAPRELTSLFQLRSAPGARCVGQFYGEAQVLERALAPLARLAGRSAQLAEGTPLEASLVWAGCEGRPLAACRLPDEDPAGQLEREHYEARGLLFDRPLPAPAIATILDHVRARAGMAHPGWLMLDAWGGAVADVPAAATAFPHRSVLFSGQVIANGPASTPSEGRWAAAFWKALAPFATDGMYSNYSFIGLEQERQDWARALWQGNLPRMRRQKRTWDPQNVFAGRQILTATGESGGGG